MKKDETIQMENRLMGQKDGIKKACTSGRWPRGRKTDGTK
jgi:hypothetical protein